MSGTTTTPTSRRSQSAPGSASVLAGLESRRRRRDGAASAEGPCDDLALLLRQAASGDVDAFLDFYDRTSGPAYCLALGRARLVGATDLAARSVADDEVVNRFVTAFLRAHEHAASGLSPLAWVLTLDVGTGTVTACA